MVPDGRGALIRQLYFIIGLHLVLLVSLYVTRNGLDGQHVSIFNPVYLLIKKMIYYIITRTFAD